MEQRTVWQELNSRGEMAVMYVNRIALVDDGEHLWIADAKRLKKAIEWARVTPADDHFAHEAYASFFGQCPGWIVTDIHEGDGFPLDIYQCGDALHAAGYEELIPTFWGQDEEVF